MNLFVLISKLALITRTHADVEAGTVVITNKAFNAFLKEKHDTVSEEVLCYVK